MPGWAAESVHLSCTLVGKDGGSETHLDVTLVETTGKASYSFRETGAIFTEKAQFTPTAVVIGASHSVKIIDRTTLEIRDSVMFRGQEQVFRSGNCEIARVEDRKF